MTASEIEISGQAREIRLAEFTRTVPGGPVAGRMSLSIDDLLIVNGVPRRIRFRGDLHEVQLGAMMAVLGQPPIEGTGHLVIESAHIENSRIQQLSLRGNVDGPSLQTVASALGSSTITGPKPASANAGGTRVVLPAPVAAFSTAAFDLRRAWISAGSVASTGRGGVEAVGLGPLGAGIGHRNLPRRALSNRRAG